MSGLNRQERTAIEAVARRFSATWENGSDTPDAYITVAGKRVAVELATLKRRGTRQSKAAKPHLRFDKVATRLIEGLQSALADSVPSGVTVLLTITAPIRLPSKTAAALEDKIQTLLKRRSPGRDEKDTIHGNRVQIRILRGMSLPRSNGRAPKIIGFVHNPETDPALLFNMTRELLELISPGAGTQATRLAPGVAPSPVSDRWLVVISGEGSSCLEAYRYIYSQLRIETGFRRIVVAFADGRVDVLTK